MPIGLPTKRGSTPGNQMSEWEREKIIEWLQEGYSVIEVYHRCEDEGFPPPSEQAITYHLRSEAVQSVLRARKAAEKGLRIASLVERSKVRDSLLSRIELLLNERAAENAGFVAGGESGLVVLTDKKSVVVGRTAESTDYQVFDIYKTDTALMSELRAVLKDQDDSDDRLRRSLRHREEHALRMTAGEVEVALAEHELAAWSKQDTAPDFAATDADSEPVANASDSQPNTGDAGANGAPFSIVYEEQDRA